MGRFILDNDYYFLSISESYDPKVSMGVSVTKAFPNSNGTFRPDTLAMAYIHPQKTGYKIREKLEIYGVVIDDENLQKLILELNDTRLSVNRQGLCFTYMLDYGDRNSGYYPLHDLFNWRKYGVSNVPNPPKELWSGIGIFPPSNKSNSFDKAPSWTGSVDPSKEIRLNAHNLFISCGITCDGQMKLWQVDSPSGHIRTVRFMGKIDCIFDNPRLEVKGLTLKGGKLKSLCKELGKNQLMVNADGWCFYCSLNDKYFYKLLFRFNWETYGVPTLQNCSCLWGRKNYMDEVETIVELVLDPRREAEVEEQITCGGEDKPIQKICVCGGAQNEQNTYGLQLEKTKEEFFLKEKELKDTSLELEKTKEEFILKEKELKDTSLELEKTKEEFYRKKEELKDLDLELEKSKEDFFQKKKELKDLDLGLEKSKEEFFQKKKELKDLDLGLEKSKEVFFQKKKELKDLESQLQEKKKDLRLCEKQLDEKDQELKKLTKRLPVEQNEVIIGSIYREYCSNKSFEKRLQKLSAVSRETHVVLAFARDYDDDNRHTNGKFKEFFDKDVIPELIADFKKNLPSNSIVKFFLCIGNRCQEYPFRVTDKYRWITNAIHSLERIIKHYGFDGIDVYYTSSSSNAKDFVYAIGTVIDELMEQRIITTASLALSPFMNRMDRNFYDTLYKKKPHNFDYVVYQTHDDADSIPLIDAQALITIFNDLVSNHNFPKEKLLAGHSILPKDWDTVPYPVIFTALPKLIKDGTIRGTSMWAITDDQP